MKTFRSVLLLTLIATLLAACSSGAKQSAAGSNVLIHFDRADYERMDRFVERFHQGEGDTLLAVAPAADSGPIIYDLLSDGKQIKVTRDDSRDAYRSSAEKTTYVCRAIDWKRTDGRERIALSGCGGVDGDIGLFDFEK